MPTALIVDHDEHASAGHIGDAAAARGYELVHVMSKVGTDAELPDPRDFDIIIITGSPEHWYEMDQEPQLQREFAFVEAAVAHDVPIFGICFGGQALAKALGGDVADMDGDEIGWFKVDTTDPEIIEPGPWFMWHDDHFTLPAGARLLASTDQCVHAFSHGPHLGLQFHPEFTNEYLVRLQDHIPTRDDVSPHEIVRFSAETESDAIIRANRLFDRFLSLQESR